MNFLRSFVLTAMLLVISTTAKAENAVAFVGSKQFLEGIVAASKTSDGTQHGGGFSRGWSTAATTSCDPKLNTYSLEDAYAKGARLILFEPCKWPTPEQGTLDKLRGMGVNIVIARPLSNGGLNSNSTSPSNEKFKSLIMKYSNSTNELSLYALQDYGLGFTLGEALKSYDIEQGNAGQLAGVLEGGNSAVISTALSPDGVLTIDGWSAKENCNPCPHGGACPQSLVEQAKQCCGQGNSCPQGN